MGRPRRDPDPDTVETLAALRSEGLGVTKCCAEAGIPVPTFYRWKEEYLAGNHEGAWGEFGRKVLAYDRHGLVVPEAPGTGDAQDFYDWVTGSGDYTRPLILDSGDAFVPEQWEIDPIEDYLSGKYKAVLLVVPEGNGKTTLTAAIVLYLLEHQLTPEIPIGSATTTQAETLFRQIEGFIVRSGKLGDFDLAPGLRRIDSRKTHGHTRVYPHNEKSGDGVIPSASVLDEAHLHPDLRLYRTWKGKYRKRKGPLFMISTAGEPGGEFEELRTKILREGERTRVEGPADEYIRAVMGDTVLHDWGVRKLEQVHDFKIVAGANPLQEIDEMEIAEKYAEPEMIEEHWLRKTCNIPTRIEGGGLTGEEWDAMLVKSLEHEKGKAYGWIDLGWKIDTTSVGVLNWVNQKQRQILDPVVLEPPVDEGDIVKAMVELQKRYGVLKWVYDPNAGGQQMVQLLEKGTHPDAEGITMKFVEHSQDNAPMALASERLDECVRGKWFEHDGNRKMRMHVLNAVKRSLGAEKFRYDRPPDAKGERRKRYPIDALTGLLMANSIATAENAKSDGPLMAVVGRSN
jgi:phage terminase large subunit-like protein